MRVTEVNPYDHWTSVADEDGYWHEENPLPVDEWTCSGCQRPVGYVTYDTAESTGLTWTQTWIPVGSDLLAADATRLCEDCAQDHEEVEV